MAWSKKTWIWIVIGVFGSGFLLLMAAAGAGVYFVSQHFSTSRTSTSEALRKLEAKRAMFKDQRPLFEVDASDHPMPTRRLADLPTSAVKPDNLWILAWDPEEQRVVSISLPFWMLRLGRRKIDVFDRDSGFDLDRLSLDMDELQRVGPMLVLDMRGHSGERVLVWTE